MAKAVPEPLAAFAPAGQATKSAAATASPTRIQFGADTGIGTAISQSGEIRMIGGRYIATTVSGRQITIDAATNLRESKIENLTGQVNGTKTDFTVSSVYYSGSLKVYLNGLLQIAAGTGQNITEVGTTGFRIAEAPLSGDYLVVDYLLGA
jgi:hypothetical protein